MTESVCTVDDCAAKRIARGVCAKHYQRLRAEGQLDLAPRERGHRGASCLHCGRPVLAQNLCSGHYQRLRRGVSIDGPIGMWAPREAEACSVDGCDLPFKALGLCAFHYRRKHAGVRLDYAPLVRNLSNQGYVLLSVPGRGALLEHRVVMEQAIGRPLLRHENVHHINGQRDDNRIENLELWSTSQPSGQRVADKVAWAVELLALYSPQLLAAQLARGG